MDVVGADRSDSMQPGFKRTSAGFLPLDWEVRSMAAVASVASGQVDPRVEPFASMPLIAPDHIESGSGRLSSDVSSAREQSAISGKYHYKSGTVIYSKIRPHLRKACIAPFPGLCSADMYPLRAAESVSAGFLFATLLSERFSRYAESVSVRSGMPKINRQELAAFEVALPPTLGEQEAIAKALADADALIDSLEQLLSKQRQIKQGAMQELLTGQRRLPGFGGEWAPKTLSELGSFHKGAGVRRDQAASGSLPCVRYGEIYTTHHDHIRSFQSWISPQVAATATRLQQGDLLFAGSGETKEEIGKCVAYLDAGEAYAGGDIVILRPTTKVSSAFMGYALNAPQVARQKASRGQGDAVVHIGSAALGSVSLPLPDPAEQHAIAQVLTDMDSALTALQARLAKARELKQALMQVLLTGRIRLLPP